jgi:translocation and assembly module TamB
MGVIKIGQSYNVVLDGNIDLTPLKALSRDIESIKGHGNFVVGISGSWDQPELMGEINIRNSTLLLTGLPHSIGPVNGDIFFDKDRVTFDSFRADFAGGTVSMSGFGLLDKFSLKRMSLSSRVEDVKFRPLEDVSMTLDGNLFFETSLKKRSLFGDINIKRAKYDKRVEWKSWLLSLKEVKEAPLEQPSFLGETELNVHITGKDDIFVDNNIARTPVKIDINVQGTLAQYGLIGRVEAKEGTIYFRGNEFKIIEGSVDFIEPNRIMPVFHIQAETFISGYRIKLDLDGPTDRFVLSLFSNPPLPEMDILTLLTAGQLTRGSKGIEGGLGAGEATAFLTGRLQDVMEERVKYITGFERFEINPQTTASGAVSPGVTVGKRLLGERLIVTYSTSVGTSDEHIVKLLYKLGKNFAIVGERDEMGNAGADFKYRFEFK